MQANTFSALVAALTFPLAMQLSSAEELTADEQDKRPSLPGQVDRDVGGSAPAIPQSFQDKGTGPFPEPGVGFRHGDHPARGTRSGAGGTGYFLKRPAPYSDSPSRPPPLYEVPTVPGYWYYCDDPPGYYPRVAECHMPWHAMPAGDTLPAE